MSLHIMNRGLNLCVIIVVLSLFGCTREKSADLRDEDEQNSNQIHLLQCLNAEQCQLLDGIQNYFMKVKDVSSERSDVTILPFSYDGKEYTFGETQNLFFELLNQINHPILLAYPVYYFHPASNGLFRTNGNLVRQIFRTLDNLLEINSCVQRYADFLITFENSVAFIKRIEAGDRAVACTKLAGFRLCIERLESIVLLLSPTQQRQIGKYLQQLIDDLRYTQQCSEHFDRFCAIQKLLEYNGVGNANGIQEEKKYLGQINEFIALGTPQISDEQMARCKSQLFIFNNPERDWSSVSLRMDLGLWSYGHTMKMIQKMEKIQNLINNAQVSQE